MTLLLLARLALAADLPPRVLEPGTPVRITALSRRDAFWRFRAEIVGQSCVVAEPGLARRRGPWYSGAVTCEDDQPFYFYQVAIELLDHVPEPTHPPPAPPELDTGAVAMTAHAESPWAVGTHVRIQAISPADATYARRPELVGKACTVAESPLVESGTGWVGGALRCDGEDLFFFQVAVEAAADAPASPARESGEPIAPGRLVKVVDLSPSDLYFPDKASLVGKTCSVTEGPLVPSGDGWYAGRLFCGEGRQWQLYQVSIAPVSP